MSASSIAGSYAASQAIATQNSLSNIFTKQNANSEAAVASLLLAAAENLEAVIASPPPGTGLSVDISA